MKPVSTLNSVRFVPSCQFFLLAFCLGANAQEACPPKGEGPDVIIGVYKSFLFEGDWNQGVGFGLPIQLIGYNNCDEECAYIAGEALSWSETLVAVGANAASGDSYLNCSGGFSDGSFSAFSQAQLEWIVNDTSNPGGWPTLSIAQHYAMFVKGPPGTPFGADYNHTVELQYPSERWDLSGWQGQYYVNGAWTTFRVDHFTTDKSEHGISIFGNTDGIDAMTINGVQYSRAMIWAERSVVEKNAGERGKIYQAIVDANTSIRISLDQLKPVFTMLDGPRDVCVGDRATYHAEAHDPDDSTNPGDGICSYKWIARINGRQFAEGVGPTIEVEWTEEGSGLLEVTVRDEEGEESVGSIFVSVRGEMENNSPPDADLSNWKSPCYNCYNYAINNKTVFFAQPRTICSDCNDVRECPLGCKSPMICMGDLEAELRKDGVARHSWNGECPAPKCCQLIAVFVVKDRDFHFVRRNADGTWSQKNGPCSAIATDNGVPKTQTSPAVPPRPMTDCDNPPHVAAERKAIRLSDEPDGAYDFCGYFCVSNDVSVDGPGSVPDTVWSPDDCVWAFDACEKSGALPDFKELCDYEEIRKRLPSGKKSENKAPDDAPVRKRTYGVLAGVEAKAIGFPPYLAVSNGVVSYYSDLEGNVIEDYQDDNGLESYLLVVIRGQVFIRGDANQSGVVDISDAVSILSSLFLTTDRLLCVAAADSDDDGSVSITDAIFMLSFMFTGGRAIPAPYPECGVDVAQDELSCEQLYCRDS